MLKVLSSLELAENGLQASRLVVEESLDDLLASDFTEEVEYLAYCMAERQISFLGPWLWCCL